MNAENVAADALMFQPMPELAAALRKRTDKVIERWDVLVRNVLPDADALTSQEVRDSIPAILEQMARALEAGEPEPTEQLAELTKVHGESRFHESYNVKELILEYRLLRKTLIDEIDHSFKRSVTAREWMALDIAVDVAMQQAVLTFLQYQGAQLKTATASEAMFLAFLAHEIRGGLNSVMLTMQWVEHSLESRKDFAEEREALISARKSATETVTSLEQLLKAERLRQNGARPVYSAVSLKTIAEKVIAQFRTAAQRKGIKLHLLVPDSAIVETDEGLLALVLQNLLGNAVKYSDNGKITVRGTTQGGERWALKVSDEGRGIPPELVARLAHAFAHSEHQTHDGSGLGLFIASKAASTLGAKLSVESKLNEGAAFTILLPGSKQNMVRQNSA